MYDVANGTAAAGSATFQLTVGSGSAGSPQGAASGDLVVVCAGSNAGGSQVISSVTDSKANTYAQQVFDGGVTNQAGIWTCLTGSALVAGTDTITVTWSSTSGAKKVVVKGSSGVSSAAADQVNHASAVSTAPDSGPTGVLNQASELVVGVICSAAAGGQPAGLSSGGAGTTATGNSAGYLTEFSQTVSSTATLDMSGTLPASANWCCLVATFRLAGSGLAVTSTSPPAGTVGTAYNGGAGYTLTASGGTSPYTWSVPSPGTGTMPPGLSLNPGSAGGHNCGATITGDTLAGLDSRQAFWNASVYPNTAMKIYFTGANATGNTFGSAALWKSNNAHVGTALDNGLGMYLCFQPAVQGTTNDTAWPGGANKPAAGTISSDQTAMINCVTSIQSACTSVANGANVAGIIMHQECDQSVRTYNAQQITYLYFKNYAGLKAAFPHIPVIICYTGYVTDPTSRAAYIPGPSPLNPGGWGPGGLYADGIATDLYGQGFDGGSTHIPSKSSRLRYYYSETPETTPGYADIADYNNIPWGNTETGNSASGGTPVALTIQNYLVGSNANGGTSNPVPLPGDSQLHSMLATYQKRIDAGRPSIPMMWYEDFSATGAGRIFDATDYRIPWLQAIDAATAQATTGLIGGTPLSDAAVTYPHAYPFTLKVKDAGGATASAALTVTVSAGTAALTVDTGALQAGTAAVAYSQQLAAHGGTSTGFTWALNSGSLAGSGISLSAGGLLAGAVPVAGSYGPLVFRVTDSGAHTALSASLTLTVAPAASVVQITTTSPLPSGTTGVAYATPDLAASGGTGPYTWSLATGSDPLPPGLVIDNADPVTDEAGGPVTDEAPGGDLS